MTTLGHNITALEIKGTFDDCQKMVKEAEAHRGEDEKRKAVVNAPVVRIVESADKGMLYVREFDAGQVIGVDKFAGHQATSVVTIITDRFGNLATAFPGVLK